MDVINNQAQPIVIEKPVPVPQVIEKPVSVLPDRPLTQGEIEYLMYKEKATNRANLISGIATLGVVGVIVGGLFWMFKKSIDVCAPVAQPVNPAPISPNPTPNPTPTV